MGRLHRAIAAAIGVAAAGTSPAVYAQAPVVRLDSTRTQAVRADATGVTTIRPEGQLVRLTIGSINGTVTDDRGGPLPGAVVSVLGVTMAMTLSDARGYYSLDALPMGEYIIQAHMNGFAGSLRERIRVGVASPSVYRFQLKKLDAGVSPSTAVVPVSARPIMAAGFELPGSTLSDQPDDGTVAGGADADHPHTETAWRLRHIKRSVLKDATSSVATYTETTDDDGELRPGSPLWRAVDTAATLAGSMFGDLPLTGEVNLLTTGIVGPGDLLMTDTTPRGVAYMAIGAPDARGRLVDARRHERGRPLVVERSRIVPVQAGCGA